MPPTGSDQEKIGTTALRRLFFAWWPPVEIQTKLHDIGRRNLPDRRVRLTQEDKIHLTLVFLGPVDEKTAQCAETLAREIQWQSFSLTLDCLGWFPRARVMWAGSSRIPPALTVLVSTLQQKLRECGVQPDWHRFQAHLTLARKVNHAPARVELLPMVCRFDRFALVESRLVPGGTAYQTIASFAADPGPVSGQ